MHAEDALFVGEEKGEAGEENGSLRSRNCFMDNEAASL